MDLVQLIDTRYAQAMRELDRVIARRDDSAQARYDRKKALAKGHEPKHYTAGAERVRHEMEIERRWVLKGAQEALEYIIDRYGSIDDVETLVCLVGEELENVEAALNQGTEEDS